MVLYCLVGLEIVKRRRALRLITSDSVPLDDTVSPPDDTSYDNPNYSVAVTVELNVNSQPRNVSTSHSTNELLLTTSNCSVIDPHRFNPPKRASLSFRQYVLMPLLFFIALLSVWVAPTTNRVASFIDPSFSSFRLLLAVGATGSLRGFWNGLVFITIGMKSWKRRRDSKEGAIHYV